MSRADVDVMNVDLEAAAADNDLYMRGEWRTETVRDLKQREDSDEYAAIGLKHQQPTLTDASRHISKSAQTNTHTPTSHARPIMAGQCRYRTE